MENLKWSQFINPHDNKKNALLLEINDPREICNFHGIFLIWDKNDFNTLIKIGKGNIGEEIYSLQRNAVLIEHNYQNLNVVFAKVIEEDNVSDRMINYIGSTFPTLIGEYFSDKTDIKVQLPLKLCEPLQVK